MNKYKSTTQRKKVSKSKRVKKKNLKKKKVKMGEVNLGLFYTILALVAIGVVMVFSASSYYALYEQENVFHFLYKEIIWAVGGLIALLIIMQFDYHKYKKATILLYVVAILCLAVTPFIGVEVNGAKRWLDIFGISFQPSELAKYATVFFLAYMIEKRGRMQESFWKGPMFYLVFVGILAGLVLVGRNLSITAVIMFVAFIMLYVSGMKRKHIANIFAMGGVLGVLAILIEPYRIARVLNFTNPFKDASGDGYQLVHSFYALGSGGLFGVGLGNSKQKALYMPEPHNDFIFSIIGEEFGLVGCTVVIGLFLILIFQGLNVAAKAKDKYGRLLAIGITSVVGIQAIINIAVVTGSMPVTGVPLPFISYGGTSLVFNLCAMGVLLNISSQRRVPNKEVKPKEIEENQTNNIYSFSNYNK
ncbi:putative lipid II flippase FtsW [Clostridium celatum]|uniref:putative lipid II flippase FtsW n=1 Tax=Clostridium celatum TaxID=36834 RepID=UPI00387ED8D1